MRVLHTSDWHLGHLLHDVSREREHAAFLRWLVATIEAEAVDALLVTGDVFDGGNPPAAAQAMWFSFLAEVHRRRPQLTVVAIAGNHDSPSRLMAPAPLLASVRAHVVGGLPREAAGGFAADQVCVPIHRASGEIGAWVVAVPFLRPMDLPSGLDIDSEGGVRGVYEAALAAARARRRPGQALVVLGHLNVTGGEPSWLSERRVSVGGVEAIGADVIGGGAGDVAYVALGHLHKAQRVGADHVRYAGAPIPLAMTEADYHQQVVVIDLAGDRVSEIRTIPVPRTIELVRVPRQAAPLPEVLAALAALEDERPGEDPELRPLLEVRVRLTEPEPHLRALIEQAVRGKRPRLVRIAPEHGGDRRALGDAAPALALADLDPRDVLRRKWRRDHDGDVPRDVMVAFEQLLAEVGAEGP
jgi:exonuclease SbcD